MKTITTAVLVDLNREAIRTNRNRALDSGWVASNIDPDGLHIIEQVLFHNDHEWRCRLFMKVNGSKEPQIGWIDVSPERWAGVERADAMIRDLFRAELGRINQEQDQEQEVTA